MIRKLKAIFLILTSILYKLAKLFQIIQETITIQIITGLELSEFDSIYKEVESKYPEYEIKRLSEKKNKKHRCRKPFQTTDETDF